MKTKKHYVVSPDIKTKYVLSGIKGFGIAIFEASNKLTDTACQHIKSYSMELWRNYDTRAEAKAYLQGLEDSKIPFVLTTQEEHEAIFGEYAREGTVYIYVNEESKRNCFSK